MAKLRRAPQRDIGQLKTTVNAFAESLDYADVEKCVRHIRDRAIACITETGGQFERGFYRLRVNWMEINERFYEMSKPNNEKHIFVFK